MHFQSVQTTYFVYLFKDSWVENKTIFLEEQIYKHTHASLIRQEDVSNHVNIT